MSKRLDVDLAGEASEAFVRDWAEFVDQEETDTLRLQLRQTLNGCIGHYYTIKSEDEGAGEPNPRQLCVTVGDDNQWVELSFQGNRFSLPQASEVDSDPTPDTIRIRVDRAAGLQKAGFIRHSDIANAIWMERFNFTPGASSDVPHRNEWVTESYAPWKDSRTYRVNRPRQAMVEALIGFVNRRVEALGIELG